MSPLGSYEDYTQFIFSLLADHPAVEHCTHPHHKHVPPDIKQHRVPAPEISFTAPNLPHLLVQIEADYE